MESLEVESLNLQRLDAEEVAQELEASEEGALDRWNGSPKHVDAEP